MSTSTFNTSLTVPKPIDMMRASADSVETLMLVNGEPSAEQTITRKVGIISQPVEVNPGLAVSFYEKNAETMERIRKAIVRNDFLNNMMDADRLKVVIQAMVPREYSANTFIIHEGDDGNQFFVSNSGGFEVLKGGVRKKQFGPGVVFGELAILYKAKRFASIRATTDATVWMLDRMIFQEIMIRMGCQEHEQNLAFLSLVPVLKTLPSRVLKKVANLLKREFYSTGTTIITQGNLGDKFYIIRGGEVTVEKKDKTSGETKVVGILKRGEWFGEQALIHQDTRSASVIANEPGTECLTLDRIAFNSFLGRMSELQKKPVDKPQYKTTQKKIVLKTEYSNIKLEDLTFIGTLGVGGFGRVELVQDKKQKTFALKMLKKHNVVSQGQIEHAYREKEIMSICNSPFIVKLYNTFRNDKYIYFLMEPCMGGDLWEQMRIYKSFDNITTRFVIGCVVEALEYLHWRDIIYRDLKPENLMLDLDGYVKLVDFGYARHVQYNQKAYTTAGTPEYVSPEVIVSMGHDRAVDYWALGILIHELLVGKTPFRDPNHVRTYIGIMRGIDAVHIPSKVSLDAQRLIRGLCRPMASDRIGYQRNGIVDIKTHRWFDGFDWKALQDRVMDAPLIPAVKSKMDMANFDDFTKEYAETPDETSNWDINF